MNNLIDNTYFKGDIQIPNLEKKTSFPTSYITPLQKNYFKIVLGYAMYKDFETELAKEEVDIPQIWKDLRDGVDYTVIIDGVSTLTRWNGFVNTEKISPIAYYVYFYWLRANYVQLTGTGVGESEKENATNYSPANKSISSWNNYIELSGNIKDYIDRSSYLTLEKHESNKYKGDDLSFIDDSVKLDESLFMYLYHNRTDFINWIFTNSININRWGI